MQLKRKKRFVAVYGEGAVTDQMCPKWFVKFLGTIDILAKKLFAVGLSCSLEDVFSITPGLYPLEANSGRYPTYLNYPNQ